jgi:hypothetical protein
MTTARTRRTESGYKARATWVTQQWLGMPDSHPDKELERRGHCFCRYADDCNIYVQSTKAGERAMQRISDSPPASLDAAEDPARRWAATQEKGNHGFHGWARLNALYFFIRAHPWNPWLNVSPQLRKKTRILAVVTRRGVWPSFLASRC